MLNKTNYLVKYYYIGLKKYHGSQRQKQYPSIEEKIIEALKTKNYIKTVREGSVNFASRTDRHVSARGAAFSFSTSKKLTLMEVNTALPKEIGLWASSSVPEGFFARFQAVSRHYKYILSKSSHRLRSLTQVQLDSMRKACKILKGRHDFQNFSKRKKDQENTVKDLDLVKMTELDEFIIFDFISRSFLRQQIRRMVRKIIDVGIGEMSLEDFKVLFDSTNYISYQPAEPEGLILWDINYGDEFELIEDDTSIERMREYFGEKKRHHSLKKKLFEQLLKRR
ncbi:MAG: tRNA pseudouridine(38-40) synthase TruA [Promethearchaeota archaeon]|nr:MAG: tRNA pseudouridine(38-40) synthase TruA [Candidatus Lokiarchaeota archaeon]